MVTFEAIQAAYYMVAATGVLVAAIYYVMNMRASKKTQELAQKTQAQTLETRQAQLFIQLYTTFTNYEFKTKWNEIMHVWNWNDAKEFYSKYGFSDSEEFSKLDLVGTFFEGVGVMVKRGLIDITLVDDLMSGHVVSSWEKFEPIIMDIRATMNWPQCLEWWEYLYREVKGIVEEQHPEVVGREVASFKRDV
jgi:hypothetical protein